MLADGDVGLLAAGNFVVASAVVSVASAVFSVVSAVSVIASACAAAVCVIVLAVVGLSAHIADKIIVSICMWAVIVYAAQNS